MVPQLARVAKVEFGVPDCSASGFEGVSLKNDVVRAAIERDKPTIILQIGDSDASGISIFDALADDILAFCDDYGHPGIIEFRRVLVRPEHETLYRLERGPMKVDADGNFADKCGAGQCPRTGLPYNPPWRYAIQAEAFAPNDLAAVLREALIEVTDMDTLARTQARGRYGNRAVVWDQGCVRVGRG
jgi:hypothetical protein